MSTGPVARILTGWDLDEPNAFVFQFDDADHTYPTGPTTLFQSSTSTVWQYAPATTVRCR